jgi:MFS family permease
MFITGGVITGVGAGMVFKGALGTVASTAPSGSRAEVLAGFFLGAYIGLSVPVIGLGVATQYVQARVAMLVFAAAAALAIQASVKAVRRRSTGSKGELPRDERRPLKRLAHGRRDHEMTTLVPSPRHSPRDYEESK